MRGAFPVGEEPLGIAMDLPDLAKHGEYRLGQGQGLLHFPPEHVLGIGGGNG